MNTSKIGSQPNFVKVRIVSVPQEATATFPRRPRQAGFQPAEHQSPRARRDPAGAAIPVEISKINRIAVWASQRVYMLLGIIVFLASLTLTAHALLTVSNTGLSGDANVTVDGPGALNIGTASSSGINIGKTGVPVAVPGSLAVNGNVTVGTTVLKPTVHQAYAIGDSRTSDGVYIGVLQTSLGAAWNINNSGITGESSSATVTRFPLAVVSPGDAEYVIVWDGINDVIGGVSAATIEGYLQTMYTAAHTAGIKVVALTNTPCLGRVGCTAGPQAVNVAVNAWIMATAINIDYKIDVYSLLNDPGNTGAYLAAYDSGDHLHPNTAGYTVVANAVFAGVTWTPSATNRTLSLSGSAALNQGLRTVDSPAFINMTLLNGRLLCRASTPLIGAGTNANVVNVNGIVMDNVCSSFGVEWLGSDSGSGYGFRAISIFDPTYGVVVWKLQKRNNSGTFTDALVVDVAGNIISPNGKLQVKGTSTDPVCTAVGDVGKIWFDTTTTTTVEKHCWNVAGTLTWHTIP